MTGTFCSSKSSDFLLLVCVQQCPEPECLFQQMNRFPCKETRSEARARARVCVVYVTCVNDVAVANIFADEKALTRGISLAHV